MKNKVTSTRNPLNTSGIKTMQITETRRFIIIATKIALTLATLVLMAKSLVAQETGQCATMHNLTRLETLDPALREKMQAIETHTQQILSLAARTATSTQGTIYNIPVVVHVVYNTSAQNISDAQIQSQIDVLNEDYRRLNADKTNTPSAFAGVAADCELTFCLAKTSPTGAFTTGIIRKSTTVTSFTDDDAVKRSSSGGDDAWPAASYLNLWVCNLGGGLLGYAQFPGGAAATDGVVILYTSFGRTGNVTAPYNKGRTATHEVGHWLNLRHIWGDANCGNDLVTDTPSQQTSNYSCPSFPHVSCSNGVHGDMFMNYMDYTDDGCMNMFSAGQKARTKALFASGGARTSLLTSIGCGSTSTTNTSAAVTVGTGTGTTGVTPYGSYNMDERTQFIITQSELVANGWTSANPYLRSLAFHAVTANSQVLNSFTIKVSHTTAGSFASNSFITGTFATVYTGNVTAVSNSWNTYSFTTAFNYNGTDDLLIEICWNNSSSTNNSPVYYTASSVYRTLYHRADVSGGGVCSSSTGTLTYNRPNIKFTFMNSSTSHLTGKQGEEENDETISSASLPSISNAILFPNPATTNVSVEFSMKEDKEITLMIFDLTGRIVKENKFTVNRGGNSVDLDVSDLEQGNYIVVMDDKTEGIKKRLIISK
jgi:hypothetical protein